MYNATGSLDASAPTSCRDMVPSGAVFRGDPPDPVAGRRDGGGGDGDGYENRVLIPLFLASALLFFVTYQLFGLAAAGGAVALFVVLALAAHRVRLSRAFPFLHLEILAELIRDWNYGAWKLLENIIEGLMILIIVS
ncbi:RING-H2 finger protein ATL63-like [Panicum miliaceum]|uniref:RING-H2 finger protein ATL63-like n=1 Tax=Panicum miliaceum TaxID=4540 RepID=A0A3L6PF29_PANMI|nr:RING-H2 finger protein ATL63-like [Panicum miliaceum]